VKAAGRWPRILVIVGLVAMVAGALDPLEGSIVIVAGAALAALGALLGRSRRRALLSWAFVLVGVGVGTMWVLSAYGGLGGDTGRSLWWALVLLPYPVGWVMGLVGTVKSLREGVAGAASSAA
jgi:MYXO-CTERM domain-containing protein